MLFRSLETLRTVGNVALLAAFPILAALTACGSDSSKKCDAVALAGLAGLGSNVAALVVDGGTVNFSIADAESTFNTTDSVYPDLGGPASGFFDWGLPFFFGRNVFVALEGASTPGGTGPYWAY